MERQSAGPDQSASRNTTLRARIRAAHCSRLIARGARDHRRNAKAPKAKTPPDKGRRFAHGSARRIARGALFAAHCSRRIHAPQIHRQGAKDAKNAKQKNHSIAFLRARSLEQNAQGRGREAPTGFRWRSSPAWPLGVALEHALGREAPLCFRWRLGLWRFGVPSGARAKRAAPTGFRWRSSPAWPLGVGSGARMWSAKRRRFPVAF